jgi:hypothetical protein
MSRQHRLVQTSPDAHRAYMRHCFQIDSGHAHKPALHPRQVIDHNFHRSLIILEMLDFQRSPSLAQILGHQSAMTMLRGWLTAQQNTGHTK